jgi:hypothetical protein
MFAYSGMNNLQPTSTTRRLFASVQTDEGNITEVWSLESMPAWANVWHIWTVLIPRRTITGKLVCGRVWRRHNGRHWIYKRFVEFQYPDI